MEPRDVDISAYDLLALDEVIDSYDHDSDPVLREGFAEIESVLWAMMEHYGEGVNTFGLDLTAHLRRTSLDGMLFLRDGLGLTERAARNFHAANLLQDLGKIHKDYDPKLWSLPHRPTEEERAQKRLHTLRGPAVLTAALKEASEAVRSHPHVATVIPAVQLFHHERIDGSGPYGLTGAQMGQVVKAVAIVDTKDGDMMRRGHQANARTEAEALLRMTGDSEHDPSGKYRGAFDDMLDRYIDYREKVTGQAIREHHPVS